MRAAASAPLEIPWFGSLCEPRGPRDERRGGERCRSKRSSEVRVEAREREGKPRQVKRYEAVLHMEEAQCL